MNEKVLNLIRSIGYKSMGNDFEPIESEELYEIAFNNKITFLYLDSLKQKGKLKLLSNYYDRNYHRYSTLFNDVRYLTPAIEKSGLNYALIKTFRYYPENPNDIDVLVFGSYEQHLEKLDDELSKIGYLKYTIGNNRYNFGKIGKIGYWDYKRDKSNLRTGDDYFYFDLDFYLQIMVEEFVHGDRKIYSKYVETKKFVNNFSGEELSVKVLTPGAELFYLFFHSIFPTRTIGLELFYSTLFILDEFTEDDYRSFSSLAGKAHLKYETACCIAHLQNLHRNAFKSEHNALKVLASFFSHQSNRINVQDSDYPFIFPLPFFIKAGLKSALHTKGLQSLTAIMIKCFNPSYSWNIMKEVISRKLAKNRYSLKYNRE